MIGARISTHHDSVADPYQAECEAMIVEHGPNYLVLDQTIFHPANGTSPGDTGAIILEDGVSICVGDTVWKDVHRQQIAHMLIGDHPALTVGMKVRAKIAWLPRYQRMRLHTALHLLSLSVPYVVLASKVEDHFGRMEFVMASRGMGRHRLEKSINRLVDRNMPVTHRWVPRSLLATERKADGRPLQHYTDCIHAIQIGNFDWQPSDSIHVRNTAEVGSIRVLGIQQAADDRRIVSIALSDARRGHSTQRRTDPPLRPLIEASAWM